MNREACYWVGVGLGLIIGWLATYVYCYYREKERYLRHKEAIKRIDNDLR